DSWGSGFAVNAVNNHNLNVRKNFDQFADVPLGVNDGGHQPFLLGFTVGGEYDPSKMQEMAGTLNVPIPGVNEVFDLDGRLLTKSFGGAVFTGFMDFPLTLSDPQERFPGYVRYVRHAADRNMHFGHVLPNVNIFLLDKDKIMEKLSRNRLNPTMIG
uniref:Uncharacterized protein n=1 Tax=Panagrolaimus sp. JU765 TaxID=591449 RepID=A0AC34RM41_9BILA